MGARTFKKADEDVLRFVREITTKKKYRKELGDAGVQVCVTMVRHNKSQPAIVRRGTPCAAIIRIINDCDRVWKPYEAEILIDEAKWEMLSDEQRLALVHHELCHLRLEGATDEGRAIVSMQMHDYELVGFRQAIETHGRSAIEVISIRAEVESAKHAGSKAMQMLLKFASEDGGE